MCATPRTGSSQRQQEMDSCRESGDGGSELLLIGYWLSVLHYKKFGDQTHGIVGLNIAEPLKMIHLSSRILGSLEHN